MADHQTLVERIAVLEVLPRERFVDDHDRRRQLVVAFGERASTLDGDPEDLEVAGRHRQPRSAAVERPVGQRPALNDEAEAVAAFERHAARRACQLDAWNRAQSFDAVADEPLDRVGREELRVLQRHPHRQHVRRIESRIDRLEREGCPDQQRGPDQQDERQRHFDDHEDGSRPVLTETGARSARALFQRGAQIRLRRVQRRNQPEQETGGD